MHELAIVMKFLRGMHPDVCAHNGHKPEEQLNELAKKFLSRAAAPEELMQLCELLRQRPEAIEWLAQELKSRRTGNAGS